MQVVIPADCLLLYFYIFFLPYLLFIAEMLLMEDSK